MISKRDYKWEWIQMENIAFSGTLCEKEEFIEKKVVLFYSFYWSSIQYIKGKAKVNKICQMICNQKKCSAYMTVSFTSYIRVENTLLSTVEY